LAKDEWLSRKTAVVVKLKTKAVVELRIES